tara:strand:- start:1133 stop:2086 length:954 start_codon:yes stop_codon:yes gene_type:complete
MVDQKFDIVGIGNAIVDVIADVEDQYLQDHEQRKGLMSLVDLEGIKKISDTLNIKTTVSGGSVANSIVCLAQHNIKCAFIGKVGEDTVGNKFIEGLSKEQVHFANSPQSDEAETGRCVVMVTPDAQRTMSTYLGISQKLNSDDINEEVIKNSGITYLEGYLWDLDDAQVAIKKATECAKKNGKKVAFSVSDVFCIERFRDSFKGIIENDADIIFANEEEAKALFEVNDLNSAIEKMKNSNKIFAITRGENGAQIITSTDSIIIQPEKIEQLVDTTGAGDIFAAGFLLEYINNKSLLDCGNKGVNLASQIIQKYGARL